jgi:hypothetical protein
VDAPLPWERLLWSSRPTVWSAPRALGDRYLLTDFRVVREHGGEVHDIPLRDIADVQRSESRFDRLRGTSTIVIHGRDRSAVVWRGVRNGPPLAALIELLAGDPNAHLDPAAVAAALAWNPSGRSRRPAESIAAVAVVGVAIAAVVTGLSGSARDTVTYPADDAIAPAGVKRDPAAIMAFMEQSVMPWAREALGPLKGGPDRVRCETCHGRDGQVRGWRMPGVAALPQPDVRERGWEQYGDRMDAQMRNAIYGYGAEPEKQSKAAYMREVVMPGMARLLHRQPYDFTQPYEYNRQHAAFGCYHCHKVK